MPQIDWDKIVSDAVDSGSLDQYYAAQSKTEEPDHLEEFRKRVEESIAKNNISLSSVKIPEPPVERNIVSEVAAAAGRGLGEAAEMTGAGLEQIGIESVGTPLKEAGRKVAGSEFLAPSDSIRKGEAGFVKRSLVSAAEVLPSALAPIIGGLVGSAIGPEGTVAGIGAGTLGQLAATGLMFGAGTYNLEKEKAKKEIAANNPNLSQKEVDQQAHDFARNQGLIQTVGMTALHFVTKGIGDEILRAAGAAAESGVTTGAEAGVQAMRSALQSGPAAIAKTAGKAYAESASTLVGLNLAQAENERAYGVGEGPSVKGALDSAATAFWLTGMLGGTGLAREEIAKNRIVSDLNSDNPLVRSKAVENVSSKINSSYGKDKAEEWKANFESMRSQGFKFDPNSPAIPAGNETVIKDKGVLEKALGATQTATADANAQFEAASKAADEATMEANPEYEAVSVLAGDAASKANSEAQFETESIATRKRAAGMPLNTEEQAALAAAEQRLARPVPAVAEPAAPPQDVQRLPPRLVDSERISTETPEQVQQGYEEYQPEPPVNPASEYGQQQADIKRFQQEAAEYNRLKNIPAKLPELPSDLRNLDSMSRQKLLEVVKKYNIPTTNETGKAIGVKAAVKRFAESERKRIASETRLRTPEEQARLDQLTGRTPERLAESRQKEQAAAARERFRQAAAGFESEPLKPAPGGEALFAAQERQAAETETMKKFAASEGEDVAAALPVMMRELSQGTAGRRLRKAGESYGYDADAGEYIAEPSSYPAWVRRHPGLSKAGSATIERVAELGRTNGKMTERQIDLWTELKQAASEEYSSNPEIIAGAEYDLLRKQGFDFESQEPLLASDFKENDSFVVIENGMPVKMTAKGVDESTGDFLFEKEDGRIVRRGAFDEIETVATKFQKETMPEGEIPFSKTQTPIENASDVRAELAKEYGAGLIDRAERRGLIKFTDQAAAERLVIEMGIDPKRSADGRVEGFVSRDGQVHLVQGNIAKGQALGVAAHELGSHAMRSGFTKEQDWLDVLAHSDRLLDKGDKAVVEARRRAEEAGTPASLLREETVAYLSNIAPKHRIIRNLIAKLKQFMINKGLASKFFISKLTAADLQSLAQGATKAAIKGKAAPEWAKGVDARLSYAGERAKTADIKRLDEAKSMQSAGVDNEEIRQKTGWFQGVDGKWRFEIDDSKVNVNPTTKGGLPQRLDEILDHKELFSAYPELKEIRVKKGYKRGEGSYLADDFISIGKWEEYNEDFKKIEDQIYQEIENLSDNELTKETEDYYNKKLDDLYKREKEASKSRKANYVYDVPSLLHEVQHAIQRYERFAGGGSVDFSNHVESMDTYKKLAGEIESRDVEFRSEMGKEERKRTKPYESQGISKEKMIIIPGEDVAVSYKITPDLRTEDTNKKGEPITRPLSAKAIAAQEPLSSVKEAVATRTEELRSGLTEGDMLARKIEEEAQKKINPRKQAQTEKDLLEQVRVFKKQHLQPEIQDMANEIFGVIDPEARRMTPAKESNLKATRAEIERLKAEGADIDPALEAKVARLDRRRIGDMLPGEAQALLDVAKELAYVNKTKNKLLAVERNRNASEVSNGIVQTIKEKPSKRYLMAEQTGVKAERGKNHVLEIGRNLIGDPASTFKVLMLDLGRGSTQSEAYKLSESVSKAQDIELRHRRELNQLMTDRIGDWQRLAESKEWNSEQEVSMPGRKVNLTSGDKVFLKYALNDHNVASSIEQLGYRRRNATGPVKFSKSDLEAIKLNTEEQKVYDSLAEYFQATYNILAPAHVEMKGYNLKTAGYGKYLPKKVSKLTINDELGNIIRSGAIENTGVIQDRIGTLNEIQGDDIFNLMLRQRDIASKYAAYAPLVRDMNLIFRSPELRNTLQMDSGVERNGKSMVENYVDDLLSDLQGSKARSDSGIEKAVRALRTNAGGAILAFRATTPLMQTASYPMALTQISAKNLLRGLKSRGGFEEAAQWNERTAARLEQGFDREMADNRNKRLVKIGMAAISYMDKATIGKLWNATKLQTAEETGLTGEKLLKKSGERFNDVLDTQPNYTTANRSMTMRTQSEIAKTLTMFSSAKSSVLNEIKTGIIIGQNTGDWSYLSKASSGLAVSAVMMGAMGTAAGAAFGKDKDLSEEAFTRVAGSIPGLDVLTSMFRGYGSTNAGIEAVSSAAEAFGRLTDLAQKKATGETVEPEQFRKSALAVLNGLSTAAGVPTENIIDNLGAGKRLLLGKDPLEQVESQLRRLEDFDFEKRKKKATKGKQGMELRAALSKLRKEFAGLDQEKISAARRLATARKRIKEIDRELEGEVPAALRLRRERMREEIAERAVK